MEDIKVVYTNGKEFVVKKNDTTYAKVNGDSLIVNRGLEKKVLQMSEVNKIKENRFDLGGTITISIVTLAFFLAIWLSTNPFKT